MDKTKISVENKGYVQFVDALLAEQDLRAITVMTSDSQITSEMLDLCQLTLAFKAPMFTKLALANYGLTVFPINQHVPIEKAEFYGNKEPEIKEQIIKKLSSTPNSTMEDQSLLPIGTYIYFLVSGSLNKWITFINREAGKDKSIDAYIREIKNIARTKWFAFDLFL